MVVRSHSRQILLNTTIKENFSVVKVLLYDFKITEMVLIAEIR